MKLRFRPMIIAGLCVTAIFFCTVAAIAQFSERPPTPKERATFSVSLLVGDKWHPYRGGLRSSEHVLVLTHGVWEDIKTAFPGPRATQIKRLGHYDDVVGVSYDWSQPTAIIAPRYAALLRRIPSRRIDIEAHSYGGMQTLAALEQSHVVPQNLILLGAPLEGTRMAISTPLTDAIKHLSPMIWHGNVGRLQEMASDGAQVDLMPQSRLQQQLMRTLKTLVEDKHVNLILVAGDATVGRGTITNLYLYANRQTRGPFSLPNDGIISVKSALALDAQNRPVLPAHRRIFSLLILHSSAIRTLCAS